MNGLLWVLTLSLVFVRVAATQQAIDIGTAIDLARKNNPDLNAARQDLEVARGQLVRAEYLSQFNPEIGSSVARRNLADGSGSSTDFDIALSQELEVAGQRGKRIDAAEKNLASVTQQVRNTERVILAEANASFYRALYSKRRLNLFRRVEEINRRLKDIANSRFRSSDIPKMEVNIAEIRWGQSRKDTIVAERDYWNGLRELERLSGLEPLGRSSLVGQLSIEPETFQEKELLRLASENRPDLQASKLEQKHVEAEIALTRRLIIPNPTIEAFYGQEEGDKIVGGGFSFPIPLFDRKQGGPYRTSWS